MLLFSSSGFDLALSVSGVALVGGAAVLLVVGLAPGDRIVFLFFSSRFDLVLPVADVALVGGAAVPTSGSRSATASSWIVFFFLPLHNFLALGQSTSDTCGTTPAKSHAPGPSAAAAPSPSAAAKPHAPGPSAAAAPGPSAAASLRASRLA